MNSALKPVLPQPGPQPGGQSSPAKANVANINHAVGLPQGAQNSLHHGTNNLVGQNLTHHAPPPQVAPHAVPSMAPVSANMAQMAQNMSHHGNLSHVTQNSVTPTNMAASPSKGASTSAPLSLVQDKANSSQPLALTRTPEKKEPDASGQANGTIDSPKTASNAPTALKPQNPEPNKEKQDIAKTSPSTPKPPEKQSSAPSTPQKTEPAGQSDGPAQPKVATANEPIEKAANAKQGESKPAPTADVAPTQSDSKPVPESANDNQLQENASTPAKEEAPAAESAKTESPLKLEEKKQEVKEEKPQSAEDAKDEERAEPAKKEEAEKLQKIEEKVEEKKYEPKTLAKDAKIPPKPTMKLATVTPPMRKRRRVSPSKSTDSSSSAKKLADGESTPDSRIKRNRTQVQLYQSPTPEIAMATKLSASAGRSTPTKQNDDKLIVFYKNEYLAVRNAEGGFYVCQAMQNVYRTTRKIKIRWLSQDKTADPSGETYKPDFYDVTDMECVLTTLSLQRAAGGAQVLRAPEQARARSILQRALAAEDSGAHLTLTEEHPDGLDLSLYTDESQLEKKSRKRNSSKTSPRGKDNANETMKDEATPAKKSRTTPKRSPKSARKSKATPTKTQTNKRKSAGSTPTVASTSKTATAVIEKSKAKTTPTKRTPAKPTKTTESPVSTPTRKGRRAAKESNPSPLVATPSTSTGKTTRTPRKPPAKK